ncbi:MAG: hypothetical protein ACM3TR_07180 [Caulobacteraceae bacterium]
MVIIFQDFAGEGYVYHIVNIIDLKKTMSEGIRYDDKKTYASKYYDFHSYLDSYKPLGIPEWVERKKAIFTSFNFKNNHTWHSHSAVLRVRIEKSRCWVCNENIANFIYEPFILQHMAEFGSAGSYISGNGLKIVQEYWNTSLSYIENLEKRYDKREGYDAEILVLHDIPPQNIECLYIISDHKMMTFKEWQDVFKPENTCLSIQYSKYLQPKSTTSAWNTSGSQ